MSLDSLAPDQRAVVQLVLQQDRSYDELAGLLGISSDAVRERAHRGLERVDPGEQLAQAERGAVVDYLLGQQSVSEREATRSLLTNSEPARAWARAIAHALDHVTRSPLPEIPGAEVARAADEEPADVEPEQDDEDEDEDEEDAALDEDQQAPAPAVRARPRPRPEPAPAAATTAARARPAPSPRSSRLGGAVLIGAVALLLVAVVIWLVSRGDDGGGGSQTAATATASATATPSATPDFQPLGQLGLTDPSGGKATGQMVIFASPSGALAFTIQGTDVPSSQPGEAYAVWLTGGDRPHRLGFAPTVGQDGKFGTSGPRDQDAKRFARWLARADRVVVARETTEDATQPGPVVLQGRIPSGAQGSGSG